MKSDQGDRLSSNFTFFLDWVAGAQFAGLYWARDRGLYEAAGLSVTLQEWQDEGLSVFEQVAQASARGELCAGCAEDNLIVGEVSTGGPFMAFGAMLERTPLVLMSHPDRAVRSFSDLKGKRVGMHADGIRALELVLALEEVSVSEIDICEVGFDLEHLRRGRVDALQGYVMTEPIQLGALGFPVDLLPIEHPLLRPFSQVYFANREVLDRHADVLESFLTTSSAGWRAVCNNPEAAARLLADVLGDRSQEAAQRRMIERLIPLIVGHDGSWEVGAIDAAQWQQNLASYLKLGMISRPVRLDQVVFQLGL